MDQRLFDTSKHKRRLRDKGPISTGVKVYLNEGDWLIANALHRHGPLSTPNLFALVSSHYTNIGSLRRRLTLLANEDRVFYPNDEGKYKEYQGPFLWRPDAQNYTHSARSNFIAYDVGTFTTENDTKIVPLAQKLLKVRGEWSDNRPSNRNPWQHGCMASAITASIEVGCIERGYRFIPQHELLDMQGATLGAEVPYYWEGVLKPARPLICVSACKFDPLSGVIGVQY